jgi:hypothetical protein
MRLKKNNKGSTIVLVLVVMTLVGIFATVALWLSLNNFQMKITNQNVTDSFYSAEAVLDQIKAGLQNQVSEAYTEAYSELLNNYTNLSTDDDRATAFGNRFVSKLQSDLKYSDGTTTIDNSCSLQLLENYVSASLKNAGNCKIYSADGSANFCLTSTVYDGDNASGLSINNICVDYTDADGYLSRIQTDILIQIPSMKIASAISPPNISDFCLIGNTGFATTSSNRLNIIGSLYAGEDGLIIDYSSVSFSAPTTMATGYDYVIVDGKVSVNNTSKTDWINLTANSGVQLWADDISVESASACLLGNTFVQDDLVLGGTTPMVSFQSDEENSTSSTYYGFGRTDGESSSSSAILLNGTDCLLNLEGLSSLTLCGYSYIGTGEITTYQTADGSNVASSASEGATTQSQVDLMMGESISVKGNQITYLVPSECIGVSTSAMTVGSSSYRNPMTYSEYNELLKEVNDGNKVFVSREVTVTRVGNSLAHYASSDGCYQTIFVPNGDGLVYFYLKLDESGAKKYFTDYYKKDSTKLLKYTDFYSKAIKCTDTSIIKAPGITLTYTEEDDGSRSVQYKDGDSSIVSSKYDSMYATLCKYLCTDDTKYSYTGKDVFRTIIAYDDTDTTNDMLYQFLQGITGYVAKNYGNARVVLANGNYTVTVDDTATNTLIIATGDVTINTGSGTSFTGTIIAQGNIKIEETMNFTIQPMDESILQSLLVQSISNEDIAGAMNEKEVTIYNFFREGEAYIVSSGSDTGAESSLSDLIIYQNWKKK